MPLENWVDVKCFQTSFTESSFCLTKTKICYASSFVSVFLERRKLFHERSVLLLLLKSKWPRSVILDKSRWIVGTGIPLLLRLFGNEGILFKRLPPHAVIGVVRFSLLKLAAFRQIFHLKNVSNLKKKNTSRIMIKKVIRRDHVYELTHGLKRSFCGRGWKSMKCKTILFLSLPQTQWRIQTWFSGGVSWTSAQKTLANWEKSHRRYAIAQTSNINDTV